LPNADLDTNQGRQTPNFGQDLFLLVRVLRLIHGLLELGKKNKSPACTPGVNKSPEVSPGLNVQTGG
jgi:hypothetical protein